MVAEAPRFSALVIGTVLVLSALFSMSIIPSNSSAHMTNHETITITGNLDLTAANGVTGGSGSEADPFTIEGWEIVFESGTGISISSTTAHLAIRNVHIVDLFYGSSGGGIELRYAENVRVENAPIDVYVNDYGQSPLLVDHCKNVTVSNCTLDPRPYSPVYVWFSQNVTVEHCFIGPQGGGDLYFSSTSDFIVRGNTFYGADGGVACYNSENGTILENDF